MRPDSFVKQSDPGSARFVVSLLAVTVLLDMIGVGILIPLAPALLGDPDSPLYLLPTHWTRDQGLALLGAVIGAYPAALFFAGPILGQLSDRYGRRRVLILSAAGTCLSYVLFAIGIKTASVSLLLISRVLDGITGGNLVVAEAVVADVSSDETRTRNFGLISASFGLGYILGPYVGGVLSVPGAPFLIGSTPTFFEAATPFWFAAALSGCNMVLLAGWLPESMRTRAAGPVVWSKALTNIGQAFVIPGARRIYPAVFFLWSGITVFTGFFPVHLVSALKFSEAEVGKFFAYSGFWLVLSQALLVPPLARRVADWRVVLGALVLLAIASVLLVVPRTTEGLLIVAPLLPISAGLAAANQVSLISRVSPPSRLGEVLGINASVSAVAEAVTALSAGYLGSVFLELPLLVAAAGAAVGALSFWILFARHPQERLG